MSNSNQQDINKRSNELPQTAHQDHMAVPTRSSHEEKDKEINELPEENETIENTATEITPNSNDQTPPSHRMEDAVGIGDATMEVILEYPTPPRDDDEITATTRMMQWREARDDDDDDESSLQVVDNAFPVTNEVEERVRQAIANAPLVEGRLVPEPSQEQPKQKRKWCPEFILSMQNGCLSHKFMISVSVLFVIAIVIPSTVLLTSRTREPFLETLTSLSPTISSAPSFSLTLHPSNAPTSYLFSAVKSIVMSVSDDEAFFDDSSPQYEALEWMVGQIGNVPRPYEDPILLNDTEKIIQRYVMAVIYFSMGGEGWTSKYNFLSNYHECYWNDNHTEEYQGLLMGLSCEDVNGSLQPYILNLLSNNLTGTIPDEIGELSSLITLDFFNNKIEGTIPESIGNLINLMLLDISFNNLSGTIPSSLGNLSELVDLWVYNSELTGVIPSSLCELRSLWVLILVQSKLTGTIPSCIGNLKNLTTLSLSENALNGTIPTEMGMLSGINQLFMSQNNFTGYIPSSIGHLPWLKWLSIYDNFLSGTIPSSIFSSSTITTISLSLNYLTGEIPPYVGNPDGMKSLVLSENILTGPLFSSVGENHNLETLALDSNTLSGKLPSNIGNASKMKHLYLDYNSFTGTVPKAYKNMQSLKWLQLHQNQLTGDINFMCSNNSLLMSSDCGGTDSEVSCNCCYYCCDRDDKCEVINLN